MTRRFNDYEQGPDFERARTQIATPFQYVDIALDVATANAVYDVSGDFLYVDASSTGVLTLELNNQYNDPAAPFYCQPGFAIQCLFKQIKLSWASQPGKKVRLMYSTGASVVPAFAAVVNIGSGAVSVVGDVSIKSAGYAYSGAYKSATALAANTPDVVFLPAANVNGAVVYDAGFYFNIASGVSVGACFIAKSSAPGSIIDGDVICAIDGPGSVTSFASRGGLRNAVKIPAGKGLYYIAGTAETSAHRFCNYTLL